MVGVYSRERAVKEGAMTQWFRDRASRAGSTRGGAVTWRIRSGFSVTISPGTRRDTLREDTRTSSRPSDSRTFRHTRMGSHHFIADFEIHRGPLVERVRFPPFATVSYAAMELT